MTDIAQIAETLDSLGLTTNERKVYIGLLTTGTSPTSVIVKEAKISSGKIYETLDKLHDKGLVSVSTINGVKHFQTTRPESLIDFIEQKKDELAAKKEKLSKILPLFNDLSPQREFFTETLVGERSVRPLIHKLLAQENGMRAMGIRGDKKQKYNNFWWHITKQVLEEGQKPSQYLFSENHSEYYKRHLGLEHVETRHTTTHSPAAIDVIGDHVLILSYEEDILHCAHIHNSAIATSFKEFFDKQWAVAKRD